MKIVILPQVANNKGDRAILHFMLESFIENGVNEIIVATSNPAMWKDYYRFNGRPVRFVHQAWMTYSNAESKVPDRSFRYYSLRVLSKLRAAVYGTIGYAVLRKAVVREKMMPMAKLMCSFCNRDQWNAIKMADAVVTTGGHRLTTLLQPDVIGHQTFSMAMAVLAAKKFYLWSQTIGAFDFKHSINRELIQRIITHSDRIYVRDETSVQEVKNFLTDNSKIYQTYDSVFGLRPSIIRYCRIPPTQREPVLGLSVYTGKSGRMIEYKQYILSLAELVKTVVKDGYSVKFFPMHVGDRLEQKYFSDIIKQSGCDAKCYIVDSYINTIEHLKQLAECKFFIGHKTHSIIFALLTATPLIAIAYHVKSMDFMRQYGLENYGFMESETTPDKLISIYRNINAKLDEIHAIESEKSDEIGRKVKQDFKDLIDEIRSYSGG